MLSCPVMGTMKRTTYIIIAAFAFAWLISSAIASESPQALIQQLGGADLDVRKTAQEELVKIGGPAVEPLIAFYDRHPDLDAKNRVCDVLVRIGSPAIQPLIRTLRPAEGKDPGGLGNGLLPQMGKDAVEPLIAALHDESPAVSAGALQTMIQIKDPRATTAVLALLKEKADVVLALRQARKDTFVEEWPVGRIAGTLGAMGDPRAIPALTVIVNENMFGASGDAARGLGYIGKPALPTLIGLLKDPLVDCTYDVMEAIKHIGDKSAVPAMLAILKSDRGGDDKAYIIRALGEMKVTSAIPAIRPFVKSSDRDLRLAAISALMALKDPNAFQYVTSLAKDSDDAHRRIAMDMLGSIKDEKAVSLLIAGMKDKSEDVRRSAIASLGHSKSPRAVNALSGLLSSGDEDTRRDVMDALTIVGEPAVDVLMSALKNPDPSIRGRAASYLGFLKEARAFAPIMALLKDKESSVRVDAAAGIGDFKDRSPAMAPLLELLQDSNWEVRNAATGALGGIHDEAVTNALIGRLLDGDQGVRWTACFSLAKSGDPKAVDALIAALADPRQIFIPTPRPIYPQEPNTARSQQVAPAKKNQPPQPQDMRPCIAAALGRSKDARAVEPLIALINDSNETLRTFVVESLGELKDPHAVEPLIGRLKDASIYVRSGAIMALTQIGDPRAVEPVRNMLDDIDPSVREVAESALKELAK